MAIMKVGSEFADSDFAFLRRFLNQLDTDLKRVNTEISVSTDPESDGLCDYGEFLIGSGFVAIQRYMTVAMSVCGIDRKKALSLPPQVNETTTYAEALNALANYWKHSEEWLAELKRTGSAKLSRNALATIEALEKVGPLLDYPCADFLAILLQERDLELSLVLPRIVEWRDNLWNELPRG